MADTTTTGQTPQADPTLTQTATSQPQSNTPSQSAPDTSNQNQSSSTSQNPQQQPPQSSDQGQQQQQQQPSLGNQPKGGSQTNVTPSQPSTPAVHPAVQKASLVHDIAQALAGGQHFTTTIDANTGQATRTPIPMSGRQIGMAIALEAISGSLAGLGAKGPNHLGQAAQMGFQQGAKDAQQAEQSQQQQADQASGDYARHAQVLETNLRLLQNARTVGREDLATNQEYVSQFKDLANMIQKDHPELVKGVINESDMPKYHVTKDSAIPYAVAKRLDPETGEQVVDHNGVPQSDLQYLVIDPTFKGDNFLSDADRKEAQKFHLQGFVDGDGNPTKLPQSLPMKLSMAMNYKSRISSLRLAENDLNNYYDTLNKHIEGGNVPLSMPMMHDQATQAIVDDAANKYKVPQALVRAVANQESGGNASLVSPKGAIGVMQLMPDTAKSLGVTDPYNAQQNIDAGTRYLKQLLDKYNGNTKLALAAYNAGPQNVTDHIPQNKETPAYVQSILKAVGMNNPQGPQAGDKNAYPKVDLVDAVQNDPTLVDALERFQPLLNASQQNYAKAIGALGAKDPQAAGKILSLYGGTSLVNHYDMNKANAQDEAKKQMENDLLLKRQAQDRSDKEYESEQSYMDDAKAIAGDPNDPGSGDMMALDKLISQRTADRPRVYALAKKINPNFNPANAELKLQTWKDFTTDQGKASQQIKSFNTLFDHIGSALDATNNFRNTNYGAAINEPINKFKKDYVGDSNLTSLIASIQPVKSEFMTFLNNNHALTEHDKNAGDDILNWNMSPAQLEGNLKKFAETSAFRLKETNEQFKRVFGTNAPGLVSDDAVNTIRKMPDVANIIGDMDTGGTFLGSSNGRGTLGRTVNQAIGRESQPKFQSYSSDGKWGWNGTTWVARKPGQ